MIRDRELSDGITSIKQFPNKMRCAQPLQTWLGEEFALAHLNKLLSIAHKGPVLNEVVHSSSTLWVQIADGTLLSRLAVWCLATNWQQSLLNWFMCPGKIFTRLSANVSSEKQMICLLFLSSMDTYILKNIIPQGNLQKEVAWCMSWRPYSFPIYSCTFKHDGFDFCLQWITINSKEIASLYSPYGLNGKYSMICKHL